MKVTGAGLAVLVACAALQGCASSGGPRQVESTRPAVAAAPAPAAPVAGAAPIPLSAEGKPVVAADTRDNFEAVAAAIRQQMQPGGRFGFASSQGRATVDSHLDDMASLFHQYDTVAKMPSPAQSQLLGDQNAINEVLAQYDGDRLVCRMEKPVGTLFPKRECRTLRQIQADQQNARDTLRQSQISIQQKSGGGA